MYNGATRENSGVQPRKKTASPSSRNITLKQSMVDLYSRPISAAAWYRDMTTSAGAENVEAKNAATTLPATCNLGPSVRIQCSRLYVLIQSYPAAVHTSMLTRAPYIKKNCARIRGSGAVIYCDWRPTKSGAAVHHCSANHQHPGTTV